MTMIKWLHKLLNHDKIDELNETMDIYRERNQQLEAEVKEYRGYKLKFEVTKLYVEDDEALLELFEVAKKNESYAASKQQQWLDGGYGNRVSQRCGLGAAGLQNLAAAGAAGLQNLAAAGAAGLQNLAAAGAAAQQRLFY